MRNVMELPEFLTEDADAEIRIKGHRVRLIDVAARYEEGHSPETIVLDHYPTLDLAVVHKVVAYYLEHEAEIKAIIDSNSSEMLRQAGLPRTTPTWHELRRRMEAKRQAEAS
jgi:uncharacterized protein (DUF433 family)